MTAPGRVATSFHGFAVGLRRRLVTRLSLERASSAAFSRPTPITGIRLAIWRSVWANRELENRQMAIHNMSGVRGVFIGTLLHRAAGGTTAVEDCSMKETEPFGRRHC